MKKLPENCQIIRRKYDLGYCSEDDFVYDIETSSGRFNGGIGQITLKNTDSCFFDFSQHWEKVLGLKLEGIAALEKSIELCQKAGKIVTSFSIFTSASIQVVVGSMMVTPLSICS